MKNDLYWDIVELMKYVHALPHHYACLGWEVVKALGPGVANEINQVFPKMVIDYEPDKRDSLFYQVYALRSRHVEIRREWPARQYDNLWLIPVLDQQWSADWASNAPSAPESLVFPINSHGGI
jgi:hypothetical protein